LFGLLGLEARLTAGLLTFTLGSSHERANLPFPVVGSAVSPVPSPGVTLLVQKYGGTSVADADRIRAVADHVARTHKQGNDVVVVVSAMGK